MLYMKECSKYFSAQARILHNINYGQDLDFITDILSPPYNLHVKPLKIYQL